MYAPRMSAEAVKEMTRAAAAAPVPGMGATLAARLAAATLQWYGLPADRWVVVPCGDEDPATTLARDVTRAVVGIHGRAPHIIVCDGGPTLPAATDRETTVAWGGATGAVHNANVRGLIQSNTALVVMSAAHVVTGAVNDVRETVRVCGGRVSPIPVYVWANAPEAVRHDLATAGAPSAFGFAAGLFGGPPATNVLVLSREFAQGYELAVAARTDNEPGLAAAAVALRAPQPRVDTLIAYQLYTVNTLRKFTRVLYAADMFNAMAAEREVTLGTGGRPTSGRPPRPAPANERARLDTVVFGPTEVDAAPRARAAAPTVMTVAFRLGERPVDAAALARDLAAANVYVGVVPTPPTLVNGAPMTVPGVGETALRLHFGDDLTDKLVTQAIGQLLRTLETRLPKK